MIFGMVFRIQFTFCGLPSATLSDLLSQNAVAVDSYRGIHSETAALPRKQMGFTVWIPSLTSLSGSQIKLRRQNAVLNLPDDAHLVGDCARGIVPRVEHMVRTLYHNTGSQNSRGFHAHWL